jgi:hypothetical protein
MSPSRSALKRPSGSGGTSPFMIWYTSDRRDSAAKACLRTGDSEQWDGHVKSDGRVGCGVCGCQRPPNAPLACI